jgi:hypothetical protein
VLILKHAKADTIEKKLERTISEGRKQKWTVAYTI